MNERLKYVLYLLMISLCTAYIAGCNIFDFTSNTELSPIEKAEEAMSKGNYEEAKKLLADSVQDSTDSYVLYLDAKATLHASGVDISKIVELIEGQDDPQSDQSLAILDVLDDLSDEDQTAWYQANMKISANLTKIFNKETTGIFEPEDITLGYTVSNLVAGVLGIRDTNQDKVIDDNDFQLNMNFLETGITEGFTFNGGTFEVEPGVEQSFSGLEVFLGGIPEDFATAKISAVLQGKEGYTPENINKILFFVLQHLDHGRQSLISLLNKSKTTFETEEIEEYLNQIALIINFYWYNDGIDNDGDGYIDEELIDGFDNDGDGLYDEDSDYTDPKVVFAPNYSPEYDVSKKENNSYRESQEFISIWEKWFKKYNGNGK